MDARKTGKNIMPISGMEITLHNDCAIDYGERALGRANEVTSQLSGLFEHIFFFDGKFNPIDSPKVRSDKARNFIHGDEVQIILDILRIEYATVAMGLANDMCKDSDSLMSRLEGDTGDWTQIGYDLYNMIGPQNFHYTVEILRRLADAFDPCGLDESVDGIFDGLVGQDERDIPKLKAAIGAALAYVKDGGEASDKVKETIGGLTEIHTYYALTTKAMDCIKDVLNVFFSRVNLERLLNVDDVATSNRLMLDARALDDNLKALKEPIAAYEAALDGVRRRANLDWILSMAGRAMAGLIKMSRTGLVIDIETVRLLSSTPLLPHEDCQTLLEYIHENEGVYFDAIGSLRTDAGDRAKAL